MLAETVFVEMKSLRRIGSLGTPFGMPALNSVEAGHDISLNLSSERQHFAGVCTEFDVMHVDPALKLPRLMRTFEAAGEDTTVLADLNGLQGTSKLVDVVGIDRPVA